MRTRISKVYDQPAVLLREAFATKAMPQIALAGKIREHRGIEIRATQRKCTSNVHHRGGDEPLPVVKPMKTHGVRIKTQILIDGEHSSCIGPQQITLV